MTLDFSPELETQIEQAARASGIEARAFVMEATRRALDPDGFKRDAEAALDALLDTLLDVRAGSGLPSLGDKQLSRAAFYDDEEQPTQ